MGLELMGLELMVLELMVLELLLEHPQEDSKEDPNISGHSKSSVML
jgi:hypothetical protein